MTLQTPRPMWQRDTVLPDDPRWPGDLSEGDFIGTSWVVAMPAPGYAICWATTGNSIYGDHRGKSGFLEVSFTTDGELSPGVPESAEILELQWTWGLYDDDLYPGEEFSLRELPHPFHDDSAIVVIGNVDDGYGFSSYRATYSTTFGSLSVEPPGHISHNNGFPGLADAMPVDSDTIVWTWGHLAQINEWESGKPSRLVTFIGSAAVGSSDSDALDTALRIEPDDVDEFSGIEGEGIQFLSLNSNGSTSTLAAWSTFQNLDSPEDDYLISAEINASGALVGGSPWTIRSDGFGVFRSHESVTDLGRTIGDTIFTSTYYTDPSVTTVDDWIEERPQLEGGDSGGVNANWQLVDSDVVEGWDGTSAGVDDVRRTWDLASGENLDAFALPGTATSRCQVGETPIWLRWVSFFGDRFDLFTLAPPYPDPFEPDPEVPHPYCLDPVADPDWHVYPDDVGLWAMGRNDRLGYVGPSWEDDSWVDAYRIIGFPSLAPLHFEHVIEDYGEDPDWIYTRTDDPNQLCVVDDTFYWFEATDFHKLHEGFGGAPVWTGDPDKWHTIAWNAADEALYVLTYDASLVTPGWELIRIDPSDWSSTVVGSGDDMPDDFLIPVVTPDGAVWAAPFETPDGWIAWLRYDGATAVMTEMPFDPYWGHIDDLPRFDASYGYTFIPTVDNSVWFLDTFTNQGYRLDASGSMSRVPLLDQLEAYQFEAVGPSPDSTVTALVSSMTDEHLWWLHICGGGWTVGRVAWGTRGAWH